MGKERENSFEFKGFDSPSYTPVPDAVFDVLLNQLGNAEIKVLLYVIRRTFGFKKGSDRISKSQLENGIVTKDGKVLDGGTGLSRRSIRLALQNLVDRKVLLKKSFESKERGFETTEYALHMKGRDPWVLSTQAIGTEVPKGLGREVPIQETVEQQPVIQKDVDVRLVSSKTTDDEAKTDYLVKSMAEALGDDNPKSRASFKRILAGLGEQTVWRLLGNTKEAYQDGVVDRSKRAAYFTGMAKNIAAEQGVDLGFKAGRKAAAREQEPSGAHELRRLRSGVGNRAAVESVKAYP